MLFTPDSNNRFRSSSLWAARSVSSPSVSRGLTLNPFYSRPAAANCRCRSSSLWAARSALSPSGSRGLTLNPFYVRLILIAGSGAPLSGQLTQLRAQARHAASAGSAIGAGRTGRGGAGGGDLRGADGRGGALCARGDAACPRGVVLALRRDQHHARIRPHVMQPWVNPINKAGVVDSQEGPFTTGPQSALIVVQWSKVPTGYTTNPKRGSTPGEPGQLQGFNLMC